MTKPVLAWGGFAGGELGYMLVDTGFGVFGASTSIKVPAVFATKAKALTEFDDVRRIEIRVMNMKIKTKEPT